MRIISWDVGIIHLAYCVLEYESSMEDGKENHSINIIDWDMINLIEEEQEKLLCCGETKKTKNKPVVSCGKNATYQLQIPGQSKPLGFCKTHLSQHQQYWCPAKTLELFERIDPKSSEGKSCSFPKKNGTLCGKKATSSLRLDDNLVYYCTAHGKSELAKKTRDYSPQMIKHARSSDYATDKLQFNLIKQLDDLIEHFAKLNIEEVVIENQPTLKNPRMKSISSTLFNYFVIRGCFDKVHGIDIKLVRFMCPNNKLKVGDDNKLTVVKNTRTNSKSGSKTSNKSDSKTVIKQSAKYKMTKALGIKFTKQLINSEQLEYLNLFKKQDDICDAYLQGRYYLEHIRFKKK